VLYSLGKSKKGFFKRNRKIDEEVVVDTLEFLMWFLLDGEDKISWYHVRYLFSFTLENYFISILHTFLYLNIQSLNVIDNFAALTMRAVLCSDSATASTSIALSLHLHLHSEPDLNLLHHDTLSITLGALLDLSILGSSSTTLGAVYISSNRHVTLCSLVELFKCDPDICTGRGSLLTLIAAPLHSLEPLQALLIVDLTLVGVREDFIGTVDLLEGTRGFLISRVLIWVILKGQFSKGTLNVRFTGLTRNLQEVVERLLIGLGKSE
jgi:hypothetical protein